MGTPYDGRETAGLGTGGAYGPKQEKPGPPSLWGQFTGLVGAMPGGITSFAGDALKDTYNAAQLPSAVSLALASRYSDTGARITQGIHRNRVLRPFVGEEMVVDAATNPELGFSEMGHRYFPAASSMFSSFRQTGERLQNQAAALAPGGLAAGDSQYGQAVREGHILPVVVEDVGNLAIVGEVGSRALARGAERAVAQAQVAEAAARVTEAAEAGGATSRFSRVTPGVRRSWLERRQILNTPRAVRRAANEAVSPSPALIDAARAEAAAPRVFEVGAGGASTTAQVVDDAAAAAAREAADQAAARALRLQRRARGLRTAARLGDTVADAPARMWTWPVQRAWRATAGPRSSFMGTAAGQALGAATDRTVGQALRNAAARSEMRRDIHERGELPFVEGAGEIRTSSIEAERGLSDVEDAAGHLAVAGVTDALAPVIQDIEGQLAAQLGLSPEDAHAWAITQALGEEVPVEAFDLGDRYQRTSRWLEEAQAARESGTAPPRAPADALAPDQFFRIQRAQQILAEQVREPRQSRYFRGHGESRGPRPVVERSGYVTDLLERQGLTSVESPQSAAADARARQQHAEVVAGRYEQRGSEPLSPVVEAAVERFGPKIDAAIRAVIDAQEVADREAGRRIVDRDTFEGSVVKQVRQVYADARQVAEVIVEQDPVLARAVGAPDARVQVTPDQLVDLVAGRLVSARGSRNPTLRQLMRDLKDAGYEVPFDLPDPRVTRAAEAQARRSERARIFARQADVAEGRAERATAARETWEGQPQKVTYAPEGTTTRLEARSRALDNARRLAAEGPNAPDADIAVREARRAAAANAFGVEVRPGEPFRVPRDRITGEQANPTPLQNYTDADGTIHDGMLADLSMRGAELHPAVDAITEVTPSRFMQGERVWIAYNGDGEAVGYIATFGGDTGLSIAVDPAAQGQGVGLRLYEAAEAGGADIAAALADEQFTEAGAALYERFVNGPAEGLSVTHEAPVQRRVFETAAAKERRLAATQQAERQAEQRGEQQAIPEADLPEPVELPPTGVIVRDGPVPRQPGASKVLIVDGVESGRAADTFADGEYIINRRTGEIIEMPDHDAPYLLTLPGHARPDGVDELGRPNYFDAMTEAQREDVYRTYNDLPFDTVAENVADELADQATGEPLYSVRVGGGAAEKFDSRELADTAEYEGGPNPYAKIAELGPKGGTVHLTRDELIELRNQADADTDANGAYSDPADIGHRQAMVTLRDAIDAQLAGAPSEVIEAGLRSILTPAQLRAVSALVNDEVGLEAAELWQRVDERIDQLEGISARSKAESGELRALRAASERLERRWPRAGEAATQADIDRLAFNATLSNADLDDIEVGALIETPPEGLLPTTETAGREGAIDVEAREATPRPELDDPELGRRLDEHLAEFEQRGRDAMYELEGEWDAKFREGDYLQHLPRQAFVAGDAQRVPPEWEWFVALPQPVQRMIRERYMAPDPAAEARRRRRGYPADPRVGTGVSPDELAQNYMANVRGGTNANFDATVAETMAEFVRLIQERDVLERVTNRRRSASDAEIEWAAERMGMDPEALKALRSSSTGGSSRQAMLERLAEYEQRIEAEDRAAQALGEPPPPIHSGRPAPWEMSVEDYAAELTETERVLAEWADAHPVGQVTGDVFDDVVEPPEVMAARQRLGELAPEAFDDPAAPVAPEVLYDRLTAAAERHGARRSPEQVRADIADWSDAWRQHAIELQAVRDQMAELLGQSDELRSTPINGVREAARGLPDSHPIARFAELQRREAGLVRREQAMVEQNQRLNNELRAIEASVPEPEPARVFDPTARGQEAVADVEQRALEAFIEDADNRRIARMSGQSVPREDLLYNGLNEPARQMYRQMVRDAKVVTEEGRLELARRQLAQKLIARGRRTQAPISRQEGRLVARERVLQSGAAEAERKATRAAERLAEGASEWEARTTTLERGLGRFGRGQRKIGLREGIARTREVDLGRAERTLIRLLDARDQAERAARNSSAAAPARFADELKAANQLREAIEVEARWLDETSDDGRGGDVLRTLTEDIPESVFDAVRAGGAAADPVHLIGGDFATSRGPGAVMGRLDQQLPYRRRTGQERIASRTEGTTKYETRGQAIETIKRYKDGVRNELTRYLEQKYGVRPHDIGSGEMRGEALVQEMRNRGFVPWDPANPLDRPPASQITGQTVFIPQELYRAFQRSSFGEKPRWKANLELWYDRRFLGTLKVGWLALSPRWLVGNVVGNGLMAVVGGGVDPVTLVQQMRRARALLAEDPSGRLLAEQQAQLARRGQLPRTLLNRGMTHEEMVFLNPDLDRPVRNPVARAARKSYAINEYTDNIFRSAVYLAKLEPRAQMWDDLNAGRISNETFMARVGNTLSARSALDAALHAAGDFQNLTPFERNVIKRAWIFYPWYRHITKLALSLPVNHPRRVIWTLHLAQLFGDEDEQTQLPPFLLGSIPLGDDRYLRTGNLNPFGQIEDSPLLSPNRAVQGLTPAITWPAAIFLGIDLSKGGEQISRPPGTERLDAYGRPTNTPLWRNPRELGRYLVTQFPQGRAAVSAVEDPVLRYGQGSPVLVQGETVPTGSGRWSGLGRLFGVPWPERIDTEGIIDRRQERIAAAQTARERYYENLNR